MHLVLDPAQDVAHGDWLRRAPGAYEWWYFDALSDDSHWSLACIWFLGNPFSPYYRLSSLGGRADPYAHNALFFALHRHGHLHAYHFTRFPRAQICADELRPATLQFGPNRLSYEDGVYTLNLADENANRRTLSAELRFSPPRALAPDPGGAVGAEDAHCWLPAAPSCRVAAAVTLREAHNQGAERVTFGGHGYHDHNWGKLPFAADIRDWYWARAALDGGRAVILYHVDYHPPRRPVSHLLLFQEGALVRHDPQAQVALSRPRVNAFGTRYATRLDVGSGDLSLAFRLGVRLDSSPFYVRALARATLTQAGRTEMGSGIAEYFWPRLLGTRLAASATQARIVPP